MTHEIKHFFFPVAANCNIGKQDVAHKLQDTGSPTLMTYRQTQDVMDSCCAIPGATASGNSLVFSTKYEDPGTNVIANVTSVGDLREKVALSWKNINVFVPQPRPSICKRLCGGDKTDEPRIKQILFDGKKLLPKKIFRIERH